MKRVYLDDDEIGAAAVALALFAVDGSKGRRVGDPIHEWITEGRRKQYEVALAAGASWAKNMVPYQSCGDHAHWLLFCLGCRNERYVNRSTDGGDHPWVASINIARLVSLPAYMDARVHPDVPPGSILHLATPDHVGVLAALDEDKGIATTCDYGGPYGAKHERAIVRRGSTLLLGGRALLGWIDLAMIERTESAIVPDSFEGGVEDDNPYDEDVVIPRGLG